MVYNIIECKLYVIVFLCVRVSFTAFIHCHCGRRKCESGECVRPGFAPDLPANRTVYKRLLDGGAEETERESKALRATRKRSNVVVCDPPFARPVTGLAHGIHFLLGSTHDAAHSTCRTPVVTPVVTHMCSTRVCIYGFPHAFQ